MLRADVMKSMRWGLTLSLMTDVYYEITLRRQSHGSLVVRRVRRRRRRPATGLPRSSRSAARPALERRLPARLRERDRAQQLVGLGTRRSSSAAPIKKLQRTQNPSLNNGADRLVGDDARARRDHPPAGTRLAAAAAPSARRPAPTSPSANRPPRPATSRPTFVAGKAVDGRPDTRWSAAGATASGGKSTSATTTPVASVTIDWEDAYASHYLIQTSTDGTTFTTAADVTNTCAGTKTTTFPAQNARYVRILGLTRGTP